MTTFLWVLSVLISSVIVYFITVYFNNKKWEVFVKKSVEDLNYDNYIISKAEMEKMKEWIEHHTFE